jgi:hypothetical protein
MTFSEFIRAHEGDDPVRLLLARDRYPGIDVALAASTLECRRRLRTKVSEWYAVPSLVYPNRLAAEQCSSAETARYKAAVAARAVTLANGEAGDARIADLTGGLGVDCWAFAGVFGEVLYNEMQTALAEAADANFKELGIRNIRISNWRVTPSDAPAAAAGHSGTATPADGDSGAGPKGSVADVLGDFVPDMVFLDPARRAEDGRKVFLLEDCRPDVLTLLPELFAAARFVLLKLSPMADISMCVNRLAHVREVHAVAAEGECKELLLLLDREWTGGYTLTAYDSGATLTWTPDEESAAAVRFASAEDLTSGGAPAASLSCAATPSSGPASSLSVASSARPGATSSPAGFLFEPGKALLKAGAFRLLSGRFGLKKLDTHTHLYVTEAVPAELAPLGKTFRILEILPLDKRTMKDVGRRYPRAEVTARNIPMTSDDLRKRLACASGGDIHIFGVFSACIGKALVVARRENL